MKPLLTLLLASLAFTVPAESWTDALSRMPAPAGQPINRSNCIERVLQALRPDQTVRAILFLPAVSDDFYLINRAAPPINLRGTNLLQIIEALTNATMVRATFEKPFLLLHLPGEPTRPGVEVRDPKRAEELATTRTGMEIRWVDRHWSALQPGLSGQLKTRLEPGAASRDAWHFARHNLAGHNLSELELLQAVSLAGDTVFSIHKRSIEFSRRPPAR